MKANNNYILEKVNILRYLLVIVVILSASNIQLSAQQLLTGQAATAAIEKITAPYNAWTSASWSGRLKSSMLPVSVNVKSYMKRDSLTLMSLRAPLLGEVVRIEIDNQALLIINKMNKRYVRYDLHALGENARMFHSNLQDILIGRVAIIGKGTLSVDDINDVDIYSIDNAGWLIAARLPEEAAGANYGFALDLESRIVDLMLTLGKTSSGNNASSNPEIFSVEASANITYDKSNASAFFNLIISNAFNDGNTQKGYEVSLEGIKIDWGQAGFGRIDLSRYILGSLRDVLKF